MEQWAGIFDGLQNLLRLGVLAGLFFGVFMGIMIGATPGLGASAGMALMLPIIFYWPPEIGLVLLVALWQADNFGGSISAILLGVPGTSGSVFTVEDGHPMARQGRGGVAIGIALTSSAIGGTTGAILFLTIAPLIAHIAVRFGPSQIFLLAVMGLTLIAASTKGRLLKGLFSAAAGLMVGFIGIDFLTGFPRWTLGTNYLMDPVRIVLIILGFYGVGRLIDSGAKFVKLASTEKIEGSMIDGMRLALRYPITLLRSGMIGAILGAVPGTGVSVATPLAYQQTVQSSRHPERFGKGEPEGVVAPESCNNAVQGGSLVPTLTLGIPGSAGAAVLLSGITMYGIRVGPRIFAEQSTLVWTVWWAVIGAVVGFIIFQLLFGRIFAQVPKIHFKYLLPPIFVLMIGGAYAQNSSPIDLVALLAFGILAYFLDRYEYPIVPFILGFILGPLAEASFYRALIVSHGSPLIFFQGIINQVMLAIFIIVLAIYFWRQRKPKQVASP